ncbi:hypothetical protein BGZ97_010907 [Linnemannia gamsii]|uniref:Uncharacterized protein n=1 Tax=Linnemannia gamsii TaxID=64522 RepID=A0A9P6R553_9FUNG|nr:hypothetical protein BGZ97_010907 [Linnemannia gamsii]
MPETISAYFNHQDPMTHLGAPDNLHNNRTSITRWISEGEIISGNHTDLDSIDSGDDIELEGDDSNNSKDMASVTTKSLKCPPVPPKRGHRDSSEIVDVDGLSDEEMTEDEPSKAPTTTGESPASNRARVDQWLKDGVDKKTREDRTDLEIDVENSLDADMNTILGMASDMELVMPKFDDNYLQDLNTEHALTRLPLAFLGPRLLLMKGRRLCSRTSQVNE